MIPEETPGKWFLSLGIAFLGGLVVAPLQLP